MAPWSIGAKVKAISLERTTLMSIGKPTPSKSEIRNRFRFRSVWVDPYMANLYRKLHENEEFLVGGGVEVCVPTVPFGAANALSTIKAHLHPATAMCLRHRCDIAPKSIPCILVTWLKRHHCDVTLKWLCNPFGSDIADGLLSLDVNGPLPRIRKDWCQFMGVCIMISVTFKLIDITDVIWDQW